MKTKLQKRLLHLQEARQRCIERADHYMATLSTIGEIHTESDIEGVCTSLNEMHGLLTKISKIRFAEFEIDKLLREIEDNESTK
tara:strand:+ start:366 stop:617 length:252 start_codon:yes stop_codon:yes gene_type:complete